MIQGAALYQVHLPLAKCIDMCLALSLARSSYDDYGPPKINAQLHEDYIFLLCCSVVLAGATVSDLKVNL